MNFFYADFCIEILDFRIFMVDLVDKCVLLYLYELVFPNSPNTGSYGHFKLGDRVEFSMCAYKNAHNSWNFNRKKTCDGLNES